MSKRETVVPAFRVGAEDVPPLLLIRLVLFTVSRNFLTFSLSRHPVANSEKILTVGLLYFRLENDPSPLFPFNLLPTSSISP